MAKALAGTAESPVRAKVPAVRLAPVPQLEESARVSAPEAIQEVQQDSSAALLEVPPGLASA